MDTQNTPPPDAANISGSNNAQATAPFLDLTASPHLAILLQQERLMHHLGTLVAQAEAGARAERDQERAERRAQHEQMTQAFQDLTNVVRLLGEAHNRLAGNMELMTSEVKTLRAAVLLAHQIGREDNGKAPLGLDTAKGNPFEIFPVPPSSPAQAFSLATAPAQNIADAWVRSGGNSGATRRDEDDNSIVVPSKKQRKKKVMSPEARARISATQRERWAARRAAIAAGGGLKFGNTANGTSSNDGDDAGTEDGDAA